MRKQLLILLVLISGLLEAQKLRFFGKDPIVYLENEDKKKLVWGYFLGLNSFDFKFDYKSTKKEVVVRPVIGFNVGLVGNVRLNDYFDLRFEPGFYATQRDLTYSTIKDPVDRLREVKGANIHFPLLLKASSLRTGNIKPFLVGGFSSTLNLGSQEDAPDDNDNGRFRLKTWTYNYELGFGIDFYLEYFKFTPSIRGVFGIGDELIRDKRPDSPWTGDINSMKTRAVLINFTFQ